MWSDIYRKMDVHTASEDGDHPLAWKQASIPVQPHLAVKDYLCHMQKHQAICNVDRKTYAGALVDMRFSCLRSLVDVLATIHYNTRQNMLGSARWDDEKSGALAAALVVCQFDALCHCSNMTTNSLLPDLNRMWLYGRIHMLFRRHAAWRVSTCTVSGK